MQAFAKRLSQGDKLTFDKAVEMAHSYVLADKNAIKRSRGALCSILNRQCEQTEFTSTPIDFDQGFDLFDLDGFFFF